MVQVVEAAGAYKWWCDKIKRQVRHPPFNVEVCLESFPRSANSYAVSTLYPLLKQQGVVREGKDFLHHTHRIETLEFSIGLGVPSIAIIRNPLEAISSAYVYHNGRRSLEALSRQYLEFYSPLITSQIFKEENFVLFEFLQVTEQLNMVIERLNSQFGWNLVTIQNIGVHKSEIFKSAWFRSNANFPPEDSVRKVGVPHPKRSEEKNKIKTSLIEVKEYARSLDLYESLLGREYFGCSH